MLVYFLLTLSLLFLGGPDHLYKYTCCCPYIEYAVYSSDMMPFGPIAYHQYRSPMILIPRIIRWHHIHVLLFISLPCRG